MTVADDPSAFLWRMVFVGGVTVLVGAVPFVATSGILERIVFPEVLGTIAIIAFFVCLAALVAIAPAYVVWSTAFVLLRRNLPDPRTRAAVSSGLCVIVGNAFLFWLLLPESAVLDQRTLVDMAGLLALTLLAGVGLTCWAFRDMGRA